MNQSIKDQLDAMAGAEALRRGDARVPDIEEFIGFCEDYDYGRDEKYNRATIMFFFKDMKILKNNGNPFTASTYTLTMNFPDRPTTNSSYGKMLLNAEKNHVGNHPKDFPGKWLHFKGEIINFRVQNQDQPAFVWNPELASTDGEAPEAEPEAVGVTTLEGVAKALNIIATATDGIKEDDFTLQAMRTPGIGKAPQDKVLNGMVQDGSFIAQQVENGTIVRDGDLLRIAPVV